MRTTTHHTVTVQDKTQASLNALEEANQAVKVARGVVQDLIAGNSTLQELKEAKKQAAAEYAAELAQLEAQHPREFEALKAAREDRKDVQSIFTDMYLAARDENVKSGTQLSLFSPVGAVEVEVKTVVKIVRSRKEPVTDDGDSPTVDP